MTIDTTHDNSAIDALPSVAQIVSALDMRARKSLGQNFLFDLNLTRRIARNAAAQLSGTTIEVGPGPGGLTRALLLEGADRVVAVEKDFRAATVLESLLHAANGRLELIEGDAMKTPLWEIGTAPRRIVAESALQYRNNPAHSVAGTCQCLRNTDTDVSARGCRTYYRPAWR